MKKNVLLYLFIFSILINVFTYVYFTNKEKYDIEKEENLTERITNLKDSLAVTTDKMERADYFSLLQNLNARNYFRGQDVEALEIKVRDGIYAKNKNTEGNPLIQYPPIDGKPYKINKIKILNNRWIIADFTNGKLWGEVLIKYFVEENGDVTYETVETLLHVNSMY
ncbi:hypothetical protein DVK85_10365 [Flavobacterium arcticum]|uniref:Hydrolase n=1 Tax=Flavobacterium arcticum TaxID=1784713 RepID=A0A345HDF6_9FLAO|nr:hypothetical protein [Flavobacterium arcticum]AXG74616.1 hypothetical protein DVK85_10365 [Flavobacterium arcticum]KAF2512262.1 hypothetical protein E0W72_03300 [Flavobacterium arcticum]